MNFFLNINGQKIDDSVYKNVITFIKNKKFETELISNIGDRVEIENKYNIFLKFSKKILIITLSSTDEIDTSFEREICLTFDNVDEMLSVFYGFRYDFMELITKETDSALIIETSKYEIEKYIESKLYGMNWKKLKNPSNMKNKSETVDCGKYLTTPEVIKKLRISDQTLANWRKNNLIDYKKISSRKYLYAAETVEQIFETGIDDSFTPTATKVKKIAIEIRNEEFYKNEITKMLRPFAFKIQEYKFKRQNFFLNFGNVGCSSSPQVMISNNFQLVDYIKKTVLCKNSEELYTYLTKIFKDGLNPRIDTSKIVQSEFSNFYLNHLILTKN